MLSWTSAGFDITEDSAHTQCDHRNLSSATAVMVQTIMCLFWNYTQGGSYDFTLVSIFIYLFVDRIPQNLDMTLSGEGRYGPRHNCYIKLLSGVLLKGFYGIRDKVCFFPYLPFCRTSQCATANSNCIINIKKSVYPSVLPHVYVPNSQRTCITHTSVWQNTEISNALHPPQVI